MTSLNFLRRKTPDTQQRLRDRVGSQMRRILFGAFLTLALLSLAFVWFFELDSWETRQRSTSLTAANSVVAYLEQVDDVFTLLITLDDIHANPDFTSQIFQENPFYLEFIRLDREGNILWDLDMAGQPVLGNSFTIKQSNWFQQAMTGKRYLSDVQLSSDGVPYVIYSRSSDGGDVIAIRLGMDFLWDLVSAQADLLNGQVYIVNASGMVIAHPSREDVFLQPIGSYEFEQAMAAPDNFYSGFYKDFQKQDVFGVSTAIPGTEWLIFTEIPANTTRTATFLALFLLGAAFLGLSTLTNRITNQSLQNLVIEPLETLQRGANQIGQGDLEHRVNLQTGDEFSEVANEFNLMAARLRQRELALTQARDEALSANRFKTQLVANVSHDLRTPLNGILGFADILKEGVYGPLNERQAGAIERVLGNTNRLILMVNNLLNEAQIEAGKITLDFQPFRPADLMAEITSLMQILAQQKGLAFRTEVDPRLPGTLIGDHQRLQQIVMNLAHNAVKFTETGEVRIRMTRRDNYKWAISVIDTGIGIPDEAHAEIFHPFHQMDGSTTRRSGGVGLGLSIVRHLVELMDGELELDSELGKGSTFTVLLPIIIPEEKKS